MRLIALLYIPVVCSFLLLCNVSLYEHTALRVLSAVDGFLNCFQLCATMNNVAKKVYAHM